MGECKGFQVGDHLIPIIRCARDSIPDGNLVPVAGQIRKVISVLQRALDETDNDMFLSLPIFVPPHSNNTFVVIEL